ncbi:hypothetical protein CVS47_02275 [Microbacterium lemovicicum]|uniref:Gram-positive cocci surface proteins LPxTG domain-containing protein n=2 Tax=Microbacterium lemovicicum TaxID=1072463 RepID=A0A3S9WC67_9MICO|nr:hypothetical protein [Microbacterium lemovicicum]AZS37634.1 hypothetical protein CVS47_02275 [Microbacterium lemovicicum]
MQRRAGILGATAVIVLAVQLGIAAPAAIAAEPSREQAAASDTAPDSTPSDPSDGATEEPAADAMPVDEAEPTEETDQSSDDAAATPAMEAAPLEEAASDDVAAAADDVEWPTIGEYRGRIDVNLRLDMVTLGQGTVASQAWRTSAPPALSASADDVFRTWGTYQFNGGQQTGVSTVVDYPILTLGQPTGYYASLSTSLTVNRGLGQTASCTIKQGRDGAALSDGPFRCEADAASGPVEGGVAIAKATFSIAINPYVRTSGIITTAKNTQGRSISLKYVTQTNNGAGYSTPPQATIDDANPSNFDDIIRWTDQPDELDRAKRVFAYQIIDDSPVKQWVIGFSQNSRGAIYRGASECFITDQDPTLPNEGLLTLHHVDVSAYTCDITSTGPVAGDRQHYSATFTVARRVMTTIDSTTAESRQRQFELLGRLCKNDASNCGVTMTTAELVTIGGDGTLPGSAGVANPSDTERATDVTVTAADSATVAFGVEDSVTVEAGFPALGTKVSATLKFSFNHSATTSRSVSQKVTVPLNPWSVGWVSDAQTVRQVKGSFVLRDGDRYFELTNATANMLDTDVPRTFYPKQRPMTQAERDKAHLGATYDPVTDTVIPLADIQPAPTVPVTSPTPQPAASTPARALAATGAPTAPTAIAGIAGAVLLAGGGLLLMLRRRRNVTRSS